MTKDYDTDDGTVAIRGRGWLDLKTVFEEVNAGKLDPDKVPDYPITTRGWFPAHKAYEILHPEAIASAPPKKSPPPFKR